MFVPGAREAVTRTVYTHAVRPEVLIKRANLNAHPVATQLIPLGTRGANSRLVASFARLLALLAGLLVGVLAVRALGKTLAFRQHSSGVGTCKAKQRVTLACETRGITIDTGVTA